MWWHSVCLEKNSELCENIPHDHQWQLTIPQLLAAYQLHHHLKSGTNLCRLSYSCVVDVVNYLPEPLDSPDCLPYRVSPRQSRLRKYRIVREREKRSDNPLLRPLAIMVGSSSETLLPYLSVGTILICAAVYDAVLMKKICRGWTADRAGP